MQTFLRVMKALADPNRVRALKLLEKQPLCVCEIQEILGIAQPTVSSHMKILEEAGLVAKERQATWVIYSLAEDSKSEYARTMLNVLKDSLNEDVNLKKMVESMSDCICRPI